MKIFFVLVFFLLSSCRYLAKSTSEQHAYLETRILLSCAKEFSVYPHNAYIIELGDKFLSTEGNLRFQLEEDGIKLNNVSTKLSKINLEGLESFTFLGKKYRGSLTVHHKKSKLYLINKLNLEDYLLSVIPAEAYPSWNIETLKAQAIASRTYALYEIKHNRRRFPKREFDLYSDTRSQVYAGIKAETRKTTKAIRDTTGEVLTYKGELIKAYFSASVGDYSAPGTEFGHDAEYLQARSLRLPNKKHPYARWTTHVPADRIAKAFKLKGPMTGIKVLSVTMSGRIDKIELSSATQTKVISGNDLRKVLGYGTMRSTYARLSLEGDKIKIDGKGFGHGVGMGQWEAQELAVRGISYDKMLTYFYKNTELTFLY
ncbi:MAG: SpoIID/LytB domain-containing protein [Brevinema sp.]